MKENLHIQSDVAEALANGMPVVALESTVITHGLPQPINLEAAFGMMDAVIEYGATPAVIAVIKGQVRIGLTRNEIGELAALPADSVRKCSRRDLPLAIARGEYGATTVAGTILLAHMAGIRIMATGGIGGVHRERTFDVSADLTELGRTPLAVVCSGAKSILDLPRTREMLETQGVPILGYRTRDMPAFFSSGSGLSVDLRVEDPAEAASVINAHLALGLGSGLLVTVPVPLEQAVSRGDAEAAIEQASLEADEQRIHGAKSTPWLLSRVSELTGGATLSANLALLKNNAAVAAQIAALLN